MIRHSWNDRGTIAVVVMSLALMVASGCEDTPSDSPADSLVETVEDARAQDGGSDASAGTDNDRDTGSPRDPGPDDAGRQDQNDEGASADPGPTPDAGPSTFGQPCGTNTDCDSELCVLTWDGYRCAPRCIETCPAGSSCRHVSGLGSDTLSFCIPDFMTSCNPCNNAADCKGPYQLATRAVCLDFENDETGLEGRFCVEPCAAENRCPEGYECRLIDNAGRAEKFCFWSREDGQPCDCHGLAIQDALDTACGVKNEFGACPGRRACGPGGLESCNAVAPAAETCNGLDEDCDGRTDEGFPDCDNDGQADCVDLDLDGDGVFEDGDGSGVAGDFPCPDGITEGCDDNCPKCGFDNPEQADSNGDGHGDRCDPCLIDADEDGFGRCEDCDDGNRLINPDAVEKCDGKDNDCDGDTDPEDAQGCRTYYRDGDRDDYGKTGDTRCLCEKVAPYDAMAGGDCNDELASVNPDAKDICNGIDDDCNGTSDLPGSEGCDHYHMDGDLDGFGAPGEYVCLCGPEGDYRTLDARDCNDRNAAIHPTARETCNRIDDNCDGTTDEEANEPCTSMCGEGSRRCVDHVLQECDAPPLNECVRYGGDCGTYSTCAQCPEKPVERCDGQDEDCDGITDGGFLLVDWDGSEVALGAPCGTGGCLGGMVACGEEGLAAVCDTSNLATTEICNGLDDDCDGVLPRDEIDEDDDGLTPCEGDCNDADAAIPAFQETCNGLDDNCDGLTDEDLGDTTCGLGNCTHTIQNCLNGLAQLCDPMEGRAEEACNGQDDDCDGATDEDVQITYFLDNDGDGFGSPDFSILACGLPEGFSENSDDCDDTLADVQPGGVESCNNIDDDCDGTADEFTKTCNNGCEDGIRHCSQGAWSDCDAPTPLTCMDFGTCQIGDTCTRSCPLPPAETCNGVDDDCDGSTDEGLGSTSCGLGVCNHTVQDCVNGSPQSCDPLQGQAAETCDHLDNDCDGATDEELGATTCGLGVCNHTVQNCINGVPQTCNPFQGQATETCDNLDNDCDGATDEELGATTCGLGVCNHTVQNCTNGTIQACNPLQGQAPETCDGLDNDCDGSTDEGLGATTCGLGVCNHTVQNCVSGVPQTCDPFQGQATEICDNLDNDCDGSTDEGLGSTTCGLGVCNHAVQNCLNGVTQTCNPFQGQATETCDNLDNDCDGSTDEQMGSTTCGLGICSHTVQNCINGTPQTCNPFQGQATETCDGLDNDCDGSTDEGLGSTNCGLGVCNHTVQNCVSGVPQTCDPFQGQATESCDNKDNDCDGSTDENLTRSCSTMCGSGSETCANGSWINCSAIQPIWCTNYSTCSSYQSCSACPNAPAESCNGRDDDCDGSTDEGVTTTYYRDYDGDGQGSTMNGTIQACSRPNGYATSSNDCDDNDAYRYVGATEVWDIRDNDCDGQQDEDGLNRFNRYYKPWTANDWEHRFSRTSLSGYEYDNHWVILYPTNVCSHSTYKPRDVCTLRDNGEWIELWGGFTLIAMSECRGILGTKHVSLYLSELSGEYDDYKNGGVLTCQRIGYYFGPASCSSFSGSTNFYRHYSGFTDPKKGDVMWSTDPFEGNPIYDVHTSAWCTPGGY